MKKLVFMFVAMAAISFASCVNNSEKGAAEDSVATDTIDSVAADSVADSTVVDSAAVAE